MRGLEDSVASQREFSKSGERSDMVCSKLKILKAGRDVIEKSFEPFPET